MRRFQVTVRIVEYRTRMALGIVLVCLKHRRIKMKWERVKGSKRKNKAEGQDKEATFKNRKWL